METVPSTEAVPIVEDAPTCAPPCALIGQPNDLYPLGAKGATLFFDVDTGVATLRTDPQNAAAAEQRIVAFTWEPSYGYSYWTNLSTYPVLLQNYGYSSGYSLWTDRLIRVQFQVAATDTPVIVVFSFSSFDVDRVIRVHEVRIPSCDPAGSGPCQTPEDCVVVESATTELLCTECRLCYDQIPVCSAGRCLDDCAGTGGNVCLNCEINSGCYDEFIDCSGLDYLPSGTFAEYL